MLESGIKDLILKPAAAFFICALQGAAVISEGLSGAVASGLGTVWYLN